MLPVVGESGHQYSVQGYGSFTDTHGTDALDLLDFKRAVVQARLTLCISQKHAG
jgi:hypothetical protein